MTAEDLVVACLARRDIKPGHQVGLGLMIATACGIEPPTVVVTADRVTITCGDRLEALVVMATLGFGFATNGCRVSVKRSLLESPWRI